MAANHGRVLNKGGVPTGFAFYKVEEWQMRNRSQNDRDITVSGRSREVRAQRSTSMRRVREWSPKDPRYPGQKRGG